VGLPGATVRALVALFAEDVMLILNAIMAEKRVRRFAHPVSGEGGSRGHARGFQAIVISTVNDPDGD